MAFAHDTTGESTLEQTLEAGDPNTLFRFLHLEEGEPYIVREELAQAQRGRANRRRSLIYAGQITDFQLSDEESPARVEYLDRNPATSQFKAAHRPQEALVAHQVEFTIRQLNLFTRSPVRQGNGRRARMVNAVMTGDLADNQHRNETEWVMRLLEGGELNPNSGEDPAGYEDELGCGTLTAEQRQALIEEAPKYTGVQDYEDYGAIPPSAAFYDPEDVRGEYRRKRFPEYDNLLDEAQEPFIATGLNVPSYVAFGNHDGLAQGNEDANQAFEAVGTGCVKAFPLEGVFGGPLGLGDGDLLDPPFIDRVLGEQGVLVPPDANRQYVDKSQFKSIFAGGEQADDHGFALVDQKEIDDSKGAAAYYSFVPDTGTRAIRYIVLDTLSEGGFVGFSSRGNIDHPQWQWLKGELAKAKRRNELVMVWAHHATDSLDANVADELTPTEPGVLPGAPPCTGTTDEHGHDPNPGCDRDPRISTPLHFGEDLIRLFHRFPQVIALIAGHSHENEVQPFKDDDGRGDFWEIKAPAIVDWPPEHRLIEVMNNRDGTLSIFTTILDHDGPSRAPGSRTTRTNASLFSLAQLASVGRTIGYNDPQEGPDGSEGRPRDRNVELLLRDPRRADRGGRNGGGGDGPGGGSGGGRSGAGTSGDGGGGAGSEAAGRGDGGSATAGLGGTAGSGGDDLPFTGLALGLLALLGAALAVAGRALRRRAA